MTTSATKPRKVASIPAGNGEFQCILRLQKDDADILHRILDVSEEVNISEDSPEGKFLAIRFEENLRRGQLRIGEKLRGFTVKDLPTIVECYKTENKVDIVKVADLSQIIECGSTPEPPPIDPDAINQPGDLQSTREARLLKHRSKDGLTAPMKNAAETRFRKTKTDTKYIDSAHVKREVTGILRRDAEAEVVQVEFLDANDNRIDSDEFPLIEPIDRTSEAQTYNAAHLVHPGEICLFCNLLIPRDRYHTPKNCSTVLPDQVVRHTWHVKEGWEFKPKNLPRLASVTAVTAEKLQEIKDSLKPGYKRPTKQPTSVEPVSVQVEVEVPVVEKSPSPVHVLIKEPVPVPALKPLEDKVQPPVKEVEKPVDPPRTNNTVEASVTVAAEEAVETPKPASPKPAAKKTGGKKKKDPNMPKNPVNAYLHWSKVHRADYVKPGMKGVDVTRAAARAWKNLTDKSVWQEMADADKKRYDREMAEYNARQC